MLEQRLADLGSVPFGREILLPLLADYRRPNDKIAEWLAKGVLVALKRGLYVVGPAWRRDELSLPLLANRLYGPSCVSLDYALSFHGLIPERVHEVTSVCLGRGRVVDTPVGRFSYARLPAPVYPVGVLRVTRGSQVAFLMAGPEKSLCDKVLLTPNLQAVSRVAMRGFLFDDLRIDPDGLAGFDLNVVRAYVQNAGKSRQMRALLAVLEDGA